MRAIELLILSVEVRGNIPFAESNIFTFTAAVKSLKSDSVRPHRQQPTRLPRPWDSPGKNTGVGCHFLLQCTKVKSESEVAQSSPTLSDPVDCSPRGSSFHGIFQARVLEWAVIAFYPPFKPLTSRNLPSAALTVRPGKVGWAQVRTGGRGGGASPPLHCPARARAPVRTPEAAPAGYLPRSPEGAALLWFCLFVCVCVYCDFAKYSRTRDTKSWSPRTRERSFWFKQLLGALEVFQRHHRKNRNYRRTPSNLAPWTPVGLALPSVCLSFGGYIVLRIRASE